MYEESPFGVLGNHSNSKNPQRRAMSLRNTLAMLIGYAALCCATAFGQVVNLVDGPVDVAFSFDLPPGNGPTQDSSGVRSALPTGLAFYTAKYSAIADKQVSFN